MTYDTKELERQFRNAGRSRKGRKKFANDASYWDGGRCEWGGGHNLREDCETLTKSFTKMESLREIKEELKKCSSKSEYDAKKANYIRKCEESISGLQSKTSSTSYFGVCCIWSQEGMDKHVISKLKTFTNELTKLKSDLEREDYKWVQELKQLKLEEAEIRKSIEENKRKAMNEKDPAQKALLLQLIEDDGKKLKANIKKQQELSNKFNFDPNKRIDDLINSIKDAIENSGGDNPGGGGRSGRNKNKDNDDDDDDNNQNNGNNTGNGSSGSGSGRKQDQNPLQNNQQLIIITGLACLVIFYLLNQKQEKESNYYDF